MRSILRHFSLLVICTFIFAENLKAQNLVVNPSFELTSSNCGNFGGEGYTTDLLNWDDANSGADSCSSPDLFSSCNIILGMPAPTHMPNSSLGYQYARTGTRHAGIILHEALDNYREYIQGTTTTPLVAGQQYCVSMYVSLANDVMYATNNIGIKFYNTSFQRNACPGQSNSLISLTPDLNYTCTPIMDTMNWVRLQWTYTAVGGEKFFVIGNFYDNAGTTIVNHPGGTFTNPYAYYYIDDVAITPNSCCYADIVKVTPPCLSGSTITLTATSGIGAICTQSVNGTWSGPGITNPTTGAFSPSVAGVGVHTVSFSLSCGYTATTSIAVSPCAVLNVCKEANGSLTASNGVPTYTWSTYVPATSTPITNQAQCQACGYTWFGFPLNQCLNGGSPATSCTTAATWSVYATGSNAMPPAGATQVMVTDASGTTLTVTPSSVPNCTTTACPTLTMSVTSQTNVNCFGASTGTASINTIGGAGPYSYTWSPGNLSGASQTSLAAGTYTINVKDANICAGTTTLTITQPTAALNAVISATTSTGCGASTGGATVTASGGTPSYTYSWVPSGGTTSGVSNLGSGNNTVTVTDAKGCTKTAVANINTIGGPTLSIASQTNINCFGSNTGTATVNPSGGTGPYSYTWTPGNLSGASQTSLAAGTYTINVRDANLCTGTTTLTITQPTSAIAAVITATTAASCGGGGTTTTVFWTEDFGAGCNQGNLASAYTGTNGAWAVTATGTNDPEANQFFVSAMENGNAAGTCGSSCGSDRSLHIGNVAVSALGLTADNGAAYNAGGFCGSFFCVATDRRAESPSINCTGQSNITLNFNYLEFGDGSNDDASLYYFDGSVWAPLFNLSKTLCCGGAACDGSLQALWTVYNVALPASANNNPNVRIGFRWVNNDDGVGTDPSFAVDDITLTTAGAGVAGGATVTASGGTPGYNYSWAPGGGSTAGVTGLSAGSNTVTVTDAKGCTVTAIANITSVGGPTLSVTSQTNVNCFGASTGTATVNGSGGTGPYTFTWSPGNLAGSSQTGLAAGVYTINVADANTCVGSGTLSITQPTSAVSAVISATSAAGCGASTGGATVTASGGTPSYTYSWVPSGGTTAGVSGLSAGNNTVIVTDNKGCTVTAIANISNTGGPVLSVTSQTNVNCFGANTGTATVSASGGTGPYSYTWSPGNLSGASQTSLAANAYTISVSDNSGCVGSGTLSITQPTAGLSAIINNSPTGCGSSTGSATVNASGGTPAYTYSWSSPPGGSSSTISNLAAGNYSVIITDSKGCQTTSITTVSSSAGGPTLSISSQTNLNCNGASNGAATINASGPGGPYTYTWTPAGGNAATATGLSAGVYTVLVGNSTSCASTITVSISQPAAITLSLTSTPASCGTFDGTASVLATGGNGALTPLWSTNSNSTTISGLSAGTYSVVVTDATGCSVSSSVFVSSSGTLTVNASGSTTIYSGESTGIIANAPSGSTVAWSPSVSISCPTCNSTIASPTVTTTYTVLASSGGCTGMDTVTVFVDIKCGELFIPSAFSPNDDGQNDVLYVIGNCIKDMEFVIFDRWGEKVFVSTDPAFGWDGTVNGKQLDPAAFAYYIKATVNGEEIVQKGSISIVK